MRIKLRPGAGCAAGAGASATNEQAASRVAQAARLVDMPVSLAQLAWHDVLTAAPASVRAGRGGVVVGDDRAAVEQSRLVERGPARQAQVAGLADDLVAHQVAGLPRLFRIEAVGPG